MLYVIGTPIGNLGDMSPRGIKTLKACDLIAAEDTRVTKKLLNHFDIHTPVTSCHEHNEEEKSIKIIERMLEEGISVALVTDAGTPAISDPGYKFIDNAIKSSIEVIAVPGPSAVIAALSVSGMDVSEFGFYGFLPRQKKALEQKLRDICEKHKIAVIYESPHRILNLMEVLGGLYENANVSVSCDLTKLYEKTLRGNIINILKQMQENPKTEKGEYCMVIDFGEAHGRQALKENAIEGVSLEARLFDKILHGLSIRDAMESLISQGEKKNAVYSASLRVKGLLE